MRVIIFSSSRQLGVNLRMIAIGQFLSLHDQSLSTEQ
jgi:hypothetical protein